MFWLLYLNQRHLQSDHYIPQYSNGNSGGVIIHHFTSEGRAVDLSFYVYKTPLIRMVSFNRIFCAFIKLRTYVYCVFIMYNTYVQKIVNEGEGKTKSSSFVRRVEKAWPKFSTNVSSVKLLQCYAKHIINIFWL